MPDFLIVLGGVTLPIRNVDTFVEEMIPNETTVETLDGHIYTDFRNNCRSWRVHFAYLCRDDYDAIRQIYFDQFDNVTYPTLVVADQDVDTFVKMDIANKNIRFSGDMIVDFEITLREQGAIS